MQELTPRKSPVPSFLNWSFGGLAFSSFTEAQSPEFKISFDTCIEKKPLDVREEIVKKLISIDKERNGKPVALCYSGGLDSEILASLLFELGIPLELYFLDIWGINTEAFNEWSSRFLRKCPIRLHRIKLNKLHFYESVSLQIFKNFGLEFPTYLAMTYLFSNIPEDQYILVADGELNRRGSLIQKLGSEILKPRSQEIVLPTPHSSVFYYLWAKSYNRRGEFYFFQSAPELISAVIQHPAFETNYPFSSTRKVFTQTFPDIPPRAETTNWDGKAYQENQFIRRWLQKNFTQDKRFQRWRPGIGAPLYAENIFLKNLSRT